MLRKELVGVILLVPAFDISICKQLMLVVAGEEVVGWYLVCSRSKAGEGNAALLNSASRICLVLYDSRKTMWHGTSTDM